VTGIGDHFGFCHVDDWETFVFSPRLDDRLGVFTILNILPMLGLKFDVLITDKEEIGQSTAGNFKTEKKYKWMFSFDRRDDQTVLYKYTDMREPCTKFFGTPGNGSFSDICRLGNLGCGGFNVATGYSKEHTPHCYASMKTWAKSVLAMKAFYAANKNVHFKYTEPKFISSTVTYGGKYVPPMPPFVEWLGYTRPKPDTIKTGTTAGGTTPKTGFSSTGTKHTTSKARVSCTHCRKTLSAADAEQAIALPNGVLCARCAEKHYDQCANCYDLTCKKEMITLSPSPITGALRIICKTCARLDQEFETEISAVNHCSNCDEVDVPCYRTHEYNKELFCDHCANYVRAFCTQCGAVKKINQLKHWIHEREDMYACPSCDAKLFKQKYGSVKKRRIIAAKPDLITVNFEAETLDTFACERCKVEMTKGQIWNRKCYCSSCHDTISFKCEICSVRCAISQKVTEMVPEIDAMNVISICKDCHAALAAADEAKAIIAETPPVASQLLLAIPKAIDIVVETDLTGQKWTGAPDLAPETDNAKATQPPN
jgi:hypothetical protein